MYVLVQHATKIRGRSNFGFQKLTANRMTKYVVQLAIHSYNLPLASYMGEAGICIKKNGRSIERRGKYTIEGSR